MGSARPARRSSVSDSAPSLALIGSSRKMKPSHTGAARYGDGRTSGQASSSAPTTMGRAGEKKRSGVVFAVNGKTTPDPFFEVPALRTATSSAPSNSAGEIVANAHAY